MGIKETQRAYDRQEPDEPDETESLAPDIAAWIRENPARIDQIARYIDFELEPADMMIFEDWVKPYAP